ncbi:MAG: TlyA family RNA methyltransferase, partial [Clostridia bacterium]|nr:TlyA family RNA methyltransferase [Clostridia bacterium]
VVVMDETNARYLKKQDFADAIDAVTVDCSFISIKTLLPVLKEVAGENGDIIALIKPQFECGKKYLGKSGVLNDKKRLFEVIKDIYDFCLSCGFTVGDFTNSPKLERKNAEYLILLKQSGQNMSFDSVKHVVENSQRSD